VSLQTFFDNFALLADAPNGVAKLRELILQLAVQGKLLPQNPSDEPSSALLEKVKAKRTKLIKERKIKKLKEIEAALPSSIKTHIPYGWQVEWLGNLAHAVTKGATPTTYGHTFQSEGIRFIKVENVKNNRIVTENIKDFISEEAHQSQARSQLESGDVLFSIAGTIGETCIVKEEDLPANTNQALAIIRGTKTTFLPDFLKLQLDSFVANAVRDKARGGAMNNVSLGDLKELLVYIPPLEEQKRIVAKVDELMRLCDELEVRQQARRASRVRLNNATLAPLNNAASLAPHEFEQATARLADNSVALYDSAETVGRLRSTILQLAVQGKLVPHDPHDEPASVLLKRIGAEREANEEKQRKRKVELPSISLHSSPFTIPSRWLWTRLGQLSKLIEYGTSEKASLDSKGVPVFRMNNIEDGRVLHSNLKYVSPKIKDLPRLYLQSGELLFNRTNSFELVGKTGIFKGESDKFTFASYLIRIRLFDSCIFPDYVNLAMNAAYFRETQINTEVTQQCGQANFNGTKLANVLIPLPPLEEQKRIVAIVNQLMALCDELETKLRQTKADSEKLMKAAVRDLLASVSESPPQESLSISV
jgi:type I restriction enzyme S subunit